MTSTSTPALAPCPFCGCAATFVKHSAGIRGTQGFDQWDAVACKHCRATVGACDRRFRCREDALNAWNRRTAPAASTPELPPLPPESGVLHDDGYWTMRGPAPHESNYAGWRANFFTAAQMRDYALAAVELNRRAESEDVAAMRNALEQALDDMDEDGQCVCLATKDWMRAALAAQGEQHGR